MRNQFLSTIIVIVNFETEFRYNRNFIIIHYVTIKIVITEIRYN